ncbi:MAG: hypothetical protein JXB32_23545 [Deltaproteobacteria bacterium]|nr:hypothetical protein [Deltaproteobacteria bacterium]
MFRTGEPNLVLEIDSATSGDRHAVAFLAGPPPAYRVDYRSCVFSAVVTAGSELLATPMRIGPSATSRAVAVAWDRRSTFGLVWVRPDFDPAMHLARIDRDGLLFDAPRPVGKPWLMPPERPEPLSLITPPYVSIAFGAGGWGIAFPQAPSSPTCRRYAGLVRTDRWGTLTDLVCLDGVLHTTQAYGDVVFDGEAFGWLHNSHFALRLVRWLVGP